MAAIRFHDALRMAAQALTNLPVDKDLKVRIIRDLYGRLRFAIDLPEAEIDPLVRTHLQDAQASLAPYSTGRDLLFRENFAFPESVFSSPDWHPTVVSLGVTEDSDSLGEIEVLVLDRQVTGQDWLRRELAPTAHPHRVVFFGLKGGVGRSTALCMAAWGLARLGKRVLLVDLDLESPGLSGLILPTEGVAEFGVIDWLIEDAVGQSDTVLGNMISRSPLGDTTRGDVHVAAAMGQRETDYLAKLARVYADVPGPKGPQPMAARLRRMIESLETRERPDVVLIDSRAGLHDLAAAAITVLGDTALLFATDNEQTWQGYRQLFQHWQRRPTVAEHVREKLAMVRALTPKSARERGVKEFRREAYELFAATLYDDIPPDAQNSSTEYFHPSESDEAAPHFAVLVDWDERFQEFDPRLRPEHGGATAAQIEAAFGSLIRWIEERVDGGGE